MTQTEKIAELLSADKRERLMSWESAVGEPDGVIGALAQDGLIDVFVRKDLNGLIIAWNWIPTAEGLSVRAHLLKDQS